MDLLAVVAIVVPSLLSGGLIMGLLGWRLNLWQFRHQAGRDNWADIQQSFKEQIESAEKRKDTEEETRLRREYEAQLEAWASGERPTVIRGADDQVLTDLWDNDADASYHPL